jgi:hypothetical protein
MRELIKIVIFFSYSFVAKKRKFMLKKKLIVFFLICGFIVTSQAAPCGAVLYRQNSGIHYSYFNVPENAFHHYFGYLEGPAWENKYCTYRFYVDSADRNPIDFIVKYKPVAILQYFDDPTVDEHSANAWGTDCFSLGTTMGLAPFRLFYNNQWINPRIGKGGRNLDSMIITIPDSSTQTPKVVITYYGWNLGGGAKVTVIWTITTIYDERPTHCEIDIIGNYTGKVGVGITNNNKRGHPVTVIKDSTKVLLATIGLQGGKSEGFTDTLLLAAFTSKKYFSSFADNNDNYGMLLTPDENQSVKWSIVYSIALETNPFYRRKNWQDSLFTETNILQNIPSEHSICSKQKATLAGFKEAYTISGRKINLLHRHSDISDISFSGIIITRTTNGSLQKQIIGWK